MTGATQYSAYPPPFVSAQTLLPISQAVLELEVTTNRSDCLAVYGVAREVHAVTEADLSRTGTHTESGTYSVADWLRIYAAHAEEHADQIRQARG